MGNELTKTHTQLAAADGRSDQRPSVVYLAGLAAGSRRTMTQSLNAMAAILAGDETADHLSIPWQYLRFQHTAALRAALADKYAHSTANKMLSALRGVLRAAWRLDLMTAEDYQAAADVKNVKGERAPAGRALAVAEVQQLLATCGDDALGLRDAAVIAILYACGLRRAELVGLDLADYDGRELRIRRGKGNKERLAPVATNAAVYLDAWLALRQAQGPRQVNGALFHGLGHSNAGGRLTTQTIYDLLRTRAAAAGIRPLSPHDFRRTFVSLLLDAGEDIVTVQRLAGHASVETTARYDRRGEDVKRRAVEKLSW
jgi:site-specific recombinase XerD